jgi:hypothetical protein
MAYKHSDGVWAGGFFAYGTSDLRLGKILVNCITLHCMAIKKLIRSQEDFRHASFL